jgi:23S rRNA (pseudouridine1915-N3)-methyltransferase
MRLRILAIGKPKLPFAKSGVEEYTHRLRSMVPLQLDFLKGGTQPAESKTLAERSAGALRVVLDERGEQVTSRDLAARFTRWEQTTGVKEVCILIGGADGHSEELRKQAEWLWSLSRLTLQHEMALLIVLEQIYRAFSLKAGSPYHRD